MFQQDVLRSNAAPFANDQGPLDDIFKFPDVARPLVALKPLHGLRRDSRDGLLHVPVQLIGSAPQVRDAGGRIQQELHELSVECLAKNLPDSIEVDVSDMELDSSILVKDLDLPNITILTEGSLAIVLAKIPTRMAGPEEVSEEAEEEVEETEEEEASE